MTGCGFSQHRLTQRFSDPPRNLHRPSVVFISSIRECHQKTRRFHLPPKPLRIDKSGGPSILPAKCRNGL